MDVQVDATMRWDGVAAVQRSRARLWVTAVAVILPVVAVAALAMWFVRAYVVPPTISIPGAMTLAAAPPDVPVRTAVTDGRAPETAPEQAPAAGDEPAAATSDRVAPASPAGLPMVQSLLLAPPVMGFSPPPAAAPVAAPQPAAGPQADQIEAGVPIAGPVPLPPRRPRPSVARASGPVPLPPARPAQ